MILKIIAAFLILVPLKVISKPTHSPKTSTLTIYSDNHERFILVLDGKEQYRFTKNDVKLTGLDQQMYEVKIIFQNDSLPIILANIYVTTPSGAVADAYYNIRRTLDGSVQLHALSFVPINAKYLSNDTKYLARKSRYDDKFLDYNAPIETRQTTKTVVHNKHNSTVITSSKNFSIVGRPGEYQDDNENGLYTAAANLFQTGEDERKIKPVAIDMSALGNRKIVKQDVHTNYMNIQNASLTEQQLDNLARVRDDGYGQNTDMQMAAGTVNEPSASAMQMTNRTDGSLTIVTTTQPSVTVTKSRAVQGTVITSQTTTYAQPIITSTVINEHPDIVAGNQASTNNRHDKTIRKVLGWASPYNDNEKAVPAPLISGMDTSIDNGQMVVSVPATVTGTAVAAHTPDNKEVITTTKTTVATTITTPGIANDGNPTSNADHATRKPDDVSSCITAMDVSSFDEAKLDISELHNDANKLSTAIMLERSFCFSSDQVYQLCMLFTSEESKLEFAKRAFIKTIDPVNYYKINNTFQDNASVKELGNFIERLKQSPAL